MDFLFLAGFSFGEAVATLYRSKTILALSR